MPRTTCRLAPLIALALAATAGLIGISQAADLHRLFEERCGRCHGHAGDFARKSLTLDGDVVRGRKTGKDIRDFLPSHFVMLSSDEIALLQDGFTMQITSKGLFQQKCRICHDPAKDLARERLIVRDGALFGRYTNVDMHDFLARHGRATPEEADLLYRMLLWQLKISKP